MGIKMGNSIDIAKTGIKVKNIKVVPSERLTVDNIGNYINVIKDSNTELGKMLSPGHPRVFSTIFGNIGNVRAGMDFVTTMSYPIDILGKSRLTKNDIAKIPRKKVSIPNYWAVVAYLLVTRIRQDSKLRELMKDNDKEYICVYIKNGEEMGKSYTSFIPVNVFGRYLSILRDIEVVIKDDKLDDDDTVMALIESYKHKETLKVFDNLPVECDAPF